MGPDAGTRTASMIHAREYGAMDDVPEPIVSGLSKSPPGSGVPALVFGSPSR